jgi:hypothetical protein
MFKDLANWYEINVSMVPVHMEIFLLTKFPFLNEIIFDHENEFFSDFS